MNNLDLYNSVRSVPDNAKKEIKGGRLSGKTDINPMWRIKVLTEQFGPCGMGWKYAIIKKQIEKADNGEAAAFVDIDLFVKFDGQWSEAIPGTGGSSFVAQESKGPFVSDECYKMALTDAISVACKALGIGADVYWEADKTKYDRQQEPREFIKYDEHPPAQQKTTYANSITPAELEKREKNIYFMMTGSKEGQRGWPVEEYRRWLKEFKEAGMISTDYSKKWTLKDLEFIESQLEELPF